jgi:hypothetical protein
MTLGLRWQRDRLDVPAPRKCGEIAEPHSTEPSPLDASTLWSFSSMNLKPGTEMQPPGSIISRLKSCRYSKAKGVSDKVTGATVGPSSNSIIKRHNVHASQSSRQEMHGVRDILICNGCISRLLCLAAP